MLNKYQNFWGHKSWISNLLIPISLLYLIISFIRKHIAKPIKFPVKVICVGNVSVGGTGKTQVVKWLAQQFQSRNIKAVIICKGYRGSFSNAKLVKNTDEAENIGDEAKYLSNFNDVIVAKNPKDALYFIKRISPEVVILDDFLQNPNIVKDYKIIVIDADRMFGNNRLLPAGPLREKFTEQEASISIAIGSKKQRPLNLNSKSLFAQIVSSTEFDLTQKYIAFAGIGNPQRFFSCLQIHGLNVIEGIEFADHHSYTNKDIERLKSVAKAFNARLITTPKDAVKLENMLDFLVFEPELKFAQNKDDVFELIYEDLKKNKILS
jgi:tetraacyldisaccharide 4'-kinase